MTTDGTDDVLTSSFLTVVSQKNVPSMIRVGLGWFSIYEVCNQLAESNVPLSAELREAWSLPSGASVGDLASIIISREI